MHRDCSCKATPAMSANRLARWALLVHQYDYTVEYRISKDHGNADALSRLPFSNDTSFDGEEMEEDVDTQVMRFMKEGWPNAFLEELSLLAEKGCVFLRHTGNNSFQST